MKGFWLLKIANKDPVFFVVYNQIVTLRNDLQIWNFLQIKMSDDEGKSDEEILKVE